MDRGAWWATVHGVSERQTRRKQFSMHTHSRVPTCSRDGSQGTLGNSLLLQALVSPRPSITLMSQAPGEQKGDRCLHLLCIPQPTARGSLLLGIITRLVPSHFLMPSAHVGHPSPLCKKKPLLIPRSLYSILPEQLTIHQVYFISCPLL